MKPAIELKNINLSYTLGGESLPVLKNVSLQVERGELLAICGPSGSGKSTFLYIMGCLLKPDRGSIIIDGVDVTKLSGFELAGLRNRTIGFVFQQFHLLPRTSVLENILLPTSYPIESALPQASDRDKAIELANQLGLGERLEHVPNQLSGGQQQRVAIARCLMREPEIVLADEPTGNLDSKSAAQVLEILKEMNRQGKTVIIITHAPEIAKECGRVVYLKDGEIVSEERPSRLGTAVKSSTDCNSDLFISNPKLGSARKAASASAMNRLLPWLQYLPLALASIPLAFENLKRNRVRSFLTMLGVMIGVAAVLAMVTLGEFTKSKILDSYAELGVNTVSFGGYPNWMMKATDVVPVMFQQFSWEKDLLPLKRIFPDVLRVSPVMNERSDSVSYSGRRIDSEVLLMGVGEEALAITRRKILVGRGLDAYHVRMKSPVCVIGYEIGERLFQQTLPIGQVLNVSLGESSFGCRVIGVFAPQSSNSEWLKPNLQVVIPYTLQQAVSARVWSSKIFDTLIELRPGSDIEQTGQGIRAYFEKKYGNSGRFRVDSDSKLISQMKRFLSLFTLLLSMIALVCLGVGGVGITNMMLVSVTERLKEIGLRKALGATDLSIRIQFLTESILLCGLAGGVGLLGGFICYETVIYVASRFIKQVPFEWVADPIAIILSLSAILAVGILAGLVPALKAERLQVIEALRSE